MAVHVRRRKTPGWPVWLSLALHLALLVSLLIIPSTQPLTSASEPLAVDFVVGEGTPEPPAAPIVPAAPIQQAEIPPVPEVPPPPPVQQAEIPPPTPAPLPEVPPPPPVQQAEILPPTPAPAPMPVPPPPLPVPQVHPPRAPPQHAAARALTSTRQARAPAGQNAATAAAMRTTVPPDGEAEAVVGPATPSIPREASQTNEGGNVKVHIVIAPDGQVTSIEVVQGSGMSVLDAAAVAVFRNAHLPPFPPGTPTLPADVVVTLHYRPADSGG